MALQLIDQFNRIFTAARLPLYLRAYGILVLSPECCLIETVTNAMSIHQLKKEYRSISLREYFKKECGGIDSHRFLKAQKNFMESTAAYSIVCYLLQLKDRHNGNIMIDNDGHIIHIDFGFMLSNSPASLNFETSPFKLTQEYIDFMDGIESDNFNYFKSIFYSGFMEARKYSDRIIGLVEMMVSSGTKLPCLVHGAKAIEDLRERFHLGSTEKEIEEIAQKLITKSINNWRTQKYDEFQHLTNGYLY